MNTPSQRRALLQCLWLATLLGLFAPWLGAAAPSQRATFNIPAGDAAETLRRYGEQSGEAIVFMVEEVRGQRTAALTGQFQASEALQKLLQGTNLEFIHDASSQAYHVGPKNNPAAAASPILAADAAGTGSVAGRVVDARTGKYLEGAEIYLEGQRSRATSARDGTFLLARVPTQSLRMIVGYPGLDQFTQEIQVSAGMTTNVDVRLVASNVIELAEFKVNGTRQGMSQATALQKASNTAKIVAAGDQFGDVSEGNPAEYLKFIPGVGVSYANHDARQISLRGLPTQFTRITVDNSPVASASSAGLNRAFEFEQVPINNIETVEIFKAVTPDQPGTSVGGGVNLVSKSAFDQEGSRLTYRAYLETSADSFTTARAPGPGREPNRKVAPGLDVNYSTRLTENIGLNIGIKDSTDVLEFPTSQYTWQYDPSTGGLPNNPYPNQWRLNRESNTTTRQNASAKLDWRISDHTKLSLGASWSWYDLIFTDRVVNLLTGNLQPLATGQQPVYSNNSVQGVAGRGSAFLTQTQQWKYGNTYLGNLNLTHETPRGDKIESTLFWTQSNTKYRDTKGGYFSDADAVITGVTVGFNNINSTVPGYTVQDTSGANVNLQDLSRYTVNRVQSRPKTGVDTLGGLLLSYSHKIDWRMPLTVKIGGRYDGTGRQVAQQNFSSTTAITGAQLTPLEETSWRGEPLGYGVPGFTWPSLYKLKDLIGVPIPYASGVLAHFDETTRAEYARLDWQVSPDLLVVGGARQEQYKTSSYDRIAGTAAKFKADKLLPSVNVKYSPGRQWVFRLGAAKTVGLPNYSDLLPTPLSISDPVVVGKDIARGRVSIYNPNLDAYSVINYDAGAEFYFGNTGFISASVFRKDFKNYIISASQTLTQATADSLGVPASALIASVDQYDVTYRLNVPEPGHYNGLELVYSQALDFLPKPFNTMGLQINYTMVRIDGINSRQQFSTDPALNAVIVDQVRKSLDLNAVKDQLNVVLNYRLGKLGVLLSANYNGNVLKAITSKTIKYSDAAANAYLNELQYFGPRTLVDLRFDYKYSQRLTPYLQLRDVFNAEQTQRAFGRLIYAKEFGEPAIELGIRGVW